MSDGMTGGELMGMADAADQPCECYQDAQTKRQQALDAFTLICQVVASVIVVLFLLAAVVAVFVIQLG